MCLAEAGGLIILSSGIKSLGASLNEAMSFRLADCRVRCGGCSKDRTRTTVAARSGNCSACSSGGAEIGMRDKSLYLIRFDDICPTMNWRVWADVEMVLNKMGIRPLLAVVPENRDSKLVVSPPVSDFWERVRAWQARGWSIGLHGYRHTYVSNSPGILNHPSAKSEFAGLLRQIQADKLHAGASILAQQGVRIDCWVAPSHTFDWTTVCLLAEMGISVISDGLWPYPHSDRLGMTWVPLQLSRLYWRPRGVWGVGYHINEWDDLAVHEFSVSVTKHIGQISCLEEIVERYRGRRLTAADQVSSHLHFAWNQRFRPFLARRLRGTEP